MTDFGIPALNGRPVDVPISTCCGSANARRDDITTSTHVQSFTATLEHRFSDILSLRNTTRYPTGDFAATPCPAARPIRHG